MAKQYVVYDAAGRILRASACEDDAIEHQAQAGEFVLEGTAELWMDYVKEGVIARRPTCPATLSGNTLTALPAPCVIEVNGEAHACTAAEVDLAFPAGDYRLIVNAWPCLPGVFAFASDGTATATPGRASITSAAPPAPSIAEYTAAVQAHLDATAQQRNYDGILSACTYATSSNAKFKAEGQACVEWRDAVWGQCYATMAAVQGGQQPAPTIAGLIASLPALTWPVA